MTTVERRAAVEIRVEGRRLTGVLMRYGDVSKSHRERFAPGSLRAAPVVHLDLHHDPERAVAWLPDGGLTLRDEETALLLAADRALDEVRTGKVGGLSVEFRAIKESVVDGIRVIHEALLSGLIGENGISRHRRFLSSARKSRVPSLLTFHRLRSTSRKPGRGKPCRGHSRQT